MGSGQTRLRIVWYFVGLTDDRLPSVCPKKSRAGILDQLLSVGLLSAGALAISAASFLEAQAKLEEAHLTEGGAIADLPGPVTRRLFSWCAPCRVHVAPTRRPFAL
jgi:hypothetical protein